MPTRAACAGSEVPAAPPHQGRGAARRCSPAASFPPNVPRVRWDPSPCTGLSPARSTTVPPPRPGGNSGRCACPEPDQGSAGTTGALPTFTSDRSAGSAPSFTPAASPRGTATHRAASPARSSTEQTRRPPCSREDRAPRQPTAATFRAGYVSRGFNHWFGFPAPFCLASAPGPLAASRRYVVGAAPARLLTSAAKLPPASTSRRGGRRWASQPTRSNGASWRTEQHVDPLQKRRLNGQEVARERARCLLTQKRPPRQASPVRRGRHTRLGQHAPHRRRRNSDAESFQLANDPPVSPARVLLREPEDQRDDR